MYDARCARQLHHELKATRELSSSPFLGRTSQHSHVANTAAAAAAAMLAQGAAAKRRGLVADCTKARQSDLPG